MNPYVFIVGCPRSGTTLLQRMVDAHSQIAIPNREQHWISKLMRRGKVAPDGLATPDLLSELGTDKRFRRLLPDEWAVQSLAAELPLPYPRFVTRALDRHGELKGKRLVGEKTPHHVHYLPLFHELWPDTRFVHLIRDGRDVALSMRDWKPSNRPGRLASWDDDPITTAAVVWDRHVRRGMEHGEVIGPALYCELRYETLVAEPEAECRRLCDFLDVGFETAMLRFHEGRERPDPRLSAKKAWRPVTSGLRDWRTDLREDEVEAFEAAAGELLEELDYPRVVGRPSSRAVERVARVRALAEGWVTPAAPWARSSSG